MGTKISSSSLFTFPACLFAEAGSHAEPLRSAAQVRQAELCPHCCAPTWAVPSTACGRLCSPILPDVMRQVEP